MRKIMVSLALLVATIAAGYADDYTIAILPKATSPDYWKAVHAGAVKAQRELESSGTHVGLIWKGPSKDGERDAQIKEVEDFVGQHVSGIILAPVDSKALVPPVEDAADVDIPVVVIDSPLETNAIVSLVAPNNYDCGKNAALCLGELLDGKGKVLLLRTMERYANTEARELGFLECLKQRYPDIKVVSSDQRAGPTEESAYTASAKLLDRFGKDLQGVFTPNEASTAGMDRALKDAGLAEGKIKHVGFDSSDQLVNALRVGDIQGLVVQDPFQMGYLSVKTMVQHLTGKGSVPKKIDTSSQLVTSDNLDDPKCKNLIHPPVSQYLN